MEGAKLKTTKLVGRGKCTRQHSQQPSSKLQLQLMHINKWSCQWVKLPWSDKQRFDTKRTQILKTQTNKSLRQTSILEKMTLFNVLWKAVIVCLWNDLLICNTFGAFFMYLFESAARRVTGIGMRVWGWWHATTGFHAPSTKLPRHLHLQILNKNIDTIDSEYLKWCKNLFSTVTSCAFSLSLLL